MTTSAVREEEVLGPAAMQALGRRLAAALPPGPGAVLTLSGHLGAGKTTLVKGLAEGLGVAGPDEVTSPTFLRLVRYDGPLPLVHVDAYRMAGAADVFELGLDEDLAGGAVVAIEWPERIAEALPPDVLALEIDHAGAASRRVRFSAGGARSAAWLARLGGPAGAA